MSIVFLLGLATLLGTARAVVYNQRAGYEYPIGLALLAVALGFLVGPLALLVRRRHPVFCDCALCLNRGAKRQKAMR